MWTWSAWVKITQTSFPDSTAYLFGAGGGGTGAYCTGICLDSNYRLKLYSTLPAPTVHHDVTTTAQLRDPSAWYHLVVAVDLDQASYVNGVRMWINGNQVTSSTLT
jgi:hypothetical protein